MDDSMNGHSMNPLQTRPGRPTAQQASQIFREHSQDISQMTDWAPGVMPAEDRDRLLSRYSRKGYKRLWHRVRLGLRGVARWLVVPLVIAAFVVGAVALAALLSGCGLAGPVGVPGPVGATHGDV